MIAEITAEQLAESLLDRLADAQAQQALIEVDKRRLLSNVQVPAEILAVQKKADDENLALNASYTQKVKSLRALKIEEMDAVDWPVEPPLPPEYVAALKAAQQRRDEIEAYYASLEAAEVKAGEAKRAQISADLREKTEGVYKDLAVKRAEIEAEFADQEAAIAKAIKELTDQAKDATKKAGHTVRGKCLMGVWAKGRDGGWNTAMLDGVALLHPEIKAARNPDGDPSVSIKAIK